MQVKADAAGVALEVAQPLEAYTDARGSPVAALGLAGEHQRINAALAVALARTWEAGCEWATGLQSAGGREREAPARAERLKQLGGGHLPEVYLQGLQSCRWAGRSQVGCCEAVGRRWRAGDTLAGMRVCRSAVRMVQAQSECLGV